MSLKTKNNHRYESTYDSLLLRGIDDPQTPRPWNLFNEIKKHSSVGKVLLDIGCGTAFKLLPLSPYLKKMIGIDISDSMLLAAKNHIEQKRLKNIQLVKATSEKIPLTPKSIDIITSMLSRWDIKELATIIKSNGIVLIEHIGCEDKIDFKKLFGKDSMGWRGQLMEYEKDKYLNLLRENFSQYFEYVTIENGFWNTYYTAHGLKELLLNTPTIRNYHQLFDKEKLDAAISLFSTKKGIKLTQNRMLIYARNSRI